MATAIATERHAPAQAEAYLDLLAGCLSRTVIHEYYQPVVEPTRAVYRWLYPSIRGFLRRKHLEIVRHYQVLPEKREVGKDWPPDAETMIGLKRLDNLRSCIRTILEDDIPGDFIETGVWRGGACIFMRGALNAYEDPTRTVWLADSFQGLPKPNPEKYAADEGDSFWTFSDYLGVSLDRVKANFERYGLLDDRVRFLVGWFSDTLPKALPSSPSPSCAWTEICTSPPSTPSAPSIPSSRSADSSSSTTTSSSPAAPPSTTTATPTALPTRWSTSMAAPSTTPRRVTHLSTCVISFPPPIDRVTPSPTAISATNLGAPSFKVLS